MDLRFLFGWSQGCRSEVFYNEMGDVFALVYKDNEHGEFAVFENSRKGLEEALNFIISSLDDNSLGNHFFSEFLDRLDEFTPQGERSFCREFEGFLFGE